MSTLAQFEKAGYRFRLHNGQVRVQGPQRLLGADHVHRLRQHKAEIERELVLRAFVDLTRSEGACVHRLLFSRGEIMALIDDQTTEGLLTATRETRQSWAAAIAQRLARQRIDSSWLAEIDLPEEATP